MKYQVKIKEVHTQIIDVEAENEQDARNKAEEALIIGVDQNNYAIPLDMDYAYTLDKDEWDVWKA